jgi:hypothetical protein
VRNGNKKAGPQAGFFVLQEALLLAGVLGSIGCALSGVSSTFGSVSSAFGGISCALCGIGSRSGSVSFRRFRSGGRSRGRSGCRRGSRCRGRLFAAGGQTNYQQGSSKEGAIHDGNYPSKVKRFIPNLVGTVQAAEFFTTLSSSHHAGADSISVCAVNESR